MIIISVDPKLEDKLYDHRVLVKRKEIGGEFEKYLHLLEIRENRFWPHETVYNIGYDDVTGIPGKRFIVTPGRILVPESQCGLIPLEIYEREFENINSQEDFSKSVRSITELCHRLYPQFYYASR